MTKDTRILFLPADHGNKVHDHIIIGDNEKFSFADTGLIEQYNKYFDSRNAP
jgi:DNA repair protein RadC